MFRAGLLHIIRRYYSVCTVGMCHAFMLTGCWQDRGGNANSQSTQTHEIYHCCIYRVVPPDDEQ